MEGTSGPVTDFFHAVESRGRSLLPPRIRGTIRVDLVNGGRTEHWYVEMTKSEAVVVTRDAKRADAVMTTSHEAFERLVRGLTPITAALLRNEVSFAGDARLVLAFRRFFPPAPGTGDPREAARQQHAHGQAWRNRLRARIL